MQPELSQCDSPLRETLPNGRVSDIRRYIKSEPTRNRFCSWAFALVAVLTLLHAARADWTLTGNDLKPQEGVGINEWSFKEGLSYTESGGTLKKSATRQLVSIINNGGKISSEAKWALSLRNGDVLVGEPVGLSQGKLQFSILELGTIDVPLKLVALLQSTDNKTPLGGAPLDRDVVRYKNGDTLDGVFVGLADGKVQIQHGDVTTAAELSHIDRLSLGGAVPARRSRRSPCASPSSPDPSSPPTPSIGNSPTSPSRTTPAPTAPASPARSNPSKSSAARCWLTDIDPARTDETTFLGTKWVMQVNTNVMGGPLKIAKAAFDRGLGVHTNSTLEYKLDGSFTQLKFAVGMDDSAAPHGQADVKVLIDGKVAWEQKGLKAGESAIQQSLDIKDAHKVELIATSAGTLDVQGRVDWVNVALIRP